ncbi:hypothetical protein A9P82_07495 [Arachidicoccus ginsenosidimutans]|uniref:hypothetical protein n=1 Tax=Arachidicoccus sp. BS20 TaxID=1850526 RepID=UPI0007F080B7|nr:hypothetical protein [Arachidicoccus sp. BS20]ANI90673.1 hypothetical protein A9P82_07495 [Arachidicoccus sp. BS20]
MSSLFPKEFKTAISNLSSAEKDKLIFRLLKKDLVLANRLSFELVNTDTVEEQREKVKKRLAGRIDIVTQNFYSPGYLNWDVREMSGTINEHVSITKDKYGEISLNLFLLNKLLAQNNTNISSSTYDKAVKFCTAVIARTFKILLLIKKMHEDYFIEFKTDLETLGKLIGNNPFLLRTAIHNGLDTNWLLSGNIPDNIEQIHKQLRQNGFLR